MILPKPQRICRVLSSGIKEGVEEAKRREQLKRDHIDTAKEYVQTLKKAASETLQDVKDLATGNCYIYYGKERKNHRRHQERTVETQRWMFHPPVSITTTLRRQSRRPLSRAWTPPRTSSRAQQVSLGKRWIPLLTKRRPRNQNRITIALR